MAYSNIADLSVEEFRNLIKEVVTQTILEIFGDPDEGLELQEGLHRSLAQTQANGETRPVQEVAARLGLEW